MATAVKIKADIAPQKITADNPANGPTRCTLVLPLRVSVISFVDISQVGTLVQVVSETSTNHIPHMYSQRYKHNYKITTVLLLLYIFALYFYRTQGRSRGGFARFARTPFLRTPFSKW